MTYALSHKRLEGIALPGLAEKMAAVATARPILIDAAALAAAAIMQRKRGMK